MLKPDRLCAKEPDRLCARNSLGLALLAPPVAAQEPGARLTGILVSEADGAPVDGAVVSLADLNDVVVWETLSNEGGAFSLPLPPPGTYRVRVSRIGYASWTSGPVRIDSAQTSGPLRLEIPVRPIPLPELMVTEQNNCPTTPEERRRAFELYESVLPILASMSTAETGDSLLVRMERPVRIWKRGRFRYTQDTVTIMVSEALSNASPGHLEAYGYADIVGDSMTTFYAPDGVALASPGFLATHCLSTAEAGTGAEVTAGLAFEPRPGREVVDVRGVL
ncbi:carboxypeptidase-like regulatory domain-containing protein [Candidatus Palauibacter sp.]|uniref:carboxypeptidase-like regulatory domain-containing protein n=1 Tax=Candidatus Palauibacter sp. TaxID=3101350 RepID=UPI003CC5AAED